MLSSTIRPIRSTLRVNSERAGSMYPSESRMVWGS